MNAPDHRDRIDWSRSLPMRCIRFRFSSAGNALKNSALAASISRVASPAAVFPCFRQMDLYRTSIVGVFAAFDEPRGRKPIQNARQGGAVQFGPFALARWT